MGKSEIITGAILAGIAIVFGLAAASFDSYAAWFFGFASAAFLLLLGIRSPFFVYLIFIISLPFEAVSVIDVGLTIRLSYILLAAVIFGLLFNGWKFRFGSPLAFPIFLLIAAAIISLSGNIFFPPPVINLAPEMALRGSVARPLIQVFYLIFIVLAYFVSLHFCSDQKRWRKAVKVFISTSLGIAAYGIYQFFAVKFSLPFVDITNALSTAGGKIGASYYTDPFFFRPHATFQEPLFFANYILSVLPLLLALFIMGIGKLKGKSGFPETIAKWSLPAIIILSTAIVLTKSRGAWIGLAFSLIFLFFVSKFKEKIKLIFSVVAVATVFCVFFLMAISERSNYDIVNYFTGRFSAQSFQEEPRITDLGLALKIWGEYPFFGVGIGNYNFYAAEYYGSRELPVAPNIWAQALAETGIFGFGALLLLVLSGAKMFFGAVKKSAGTPWRPYAVGYAACFIAMMGQYLFSFDRLPLLFWVFAGIFAGAAGLITKNGADNYQI